MKSLYRVADVQRILYHGGTEKSEKTLTKIGSAKLGQYPDAITYDPAAKRVFASSGHDGTAISIEAATGSVVGSINLGGSPEFAPADRQGHIDNNLEDS
ncbi:MAG: hypothetical protein WCA20_19165 [Candidatus Sulfotelmatobacter sp.]